ncbi:MAG: ABC transporter permease subunit [Anaerolineae bacterium]|nr:ABC transporter permease subunit [Anaerolineae bacterium]MDW8099549.1 ABC transporter permease subunit [Anaerolineae bacterium]
MSNKSSFLVKQGAHQARPIVFHPWRDVLWVLPFFLFIFLFIILPSASLLFGSFQDKQGNFTFQNYLDLFKPSIFSAYWVSIRISLASAVGGGILGFMMAYGVTAGGLPRRLRSVLLTFSGVASNFAGVPLAFAFMATLGRTGMITVLIKTLFGINLYDLGFSIYSFWGLTFTYIYFQFPLMVLIITPALDGLRREWREAAEILGASSWDYWRRVALPILTPSILGAIILLFGNAFGAYATAVSLTGGFINLITILIGSQIKGDVLQNLGLGYALAIGMVIVMALMIALYYPLRRRSERWLKL